MTKKSSLRQYVESQGVNIQTYTSRIKIGKSHEEAMSLVKGRVRVLDMNDIKNIKALIHEKELLKDKLFSLTDKAIADKFGVSRQTITGIASGRYHRDIK